MSIGKIWKRNIACLCCFVFTAYEVQGTNEGVGGCVCVCVCGCVCGGGGGVVGLVSLNNKFS